jgi:hypothetical protein
MNAGPGARRSRVCGVAIVGSDTSRDRSSVVDAVVGELAVAGRMPW